MSERPFMQLYVSDFVGDTLHLSTEQIGAYMLLLMAMWNADGKLPADDQKLARVVRMSVKKWRAISGDLMAFFEGNEDHIWHNRLTKELQKSEAKSHLRASAGARGGAAKALKTNSTPLANASRLPQHLPDTRNQIAASQLSAPKFLYDKIMAAASSKGTCHPNLALGFSQITALISKGYDLDRDILPVISEKARPDISTWAYFAKIIIQRAEERAAIPAKPVKAEADWGARMRDFRADGFWPAKWGPKPGEPGCQAPAELIDRAAA